MDQPAIARPTCALLRQLASSDGIKASLVEVGGLAAVVQLLHAHPRNYPLLEQVGSSFAFLLALSLVIERKEAVYMAYLACHRACLACTELSR